MNNYKYYIVQNGIRIGRFNLFNEVQYAIQFCQNGLVLSEEQWKKIYGES